MTLKLFVKENRNLLIFLLISLVVQLISAFLEKSILDSFLTHTAASLLVMVVSSLNSVIVFVPLYLFKKKYVFTGIGAFIGSIILCSFLFLPVLGLIFIVISLLPFSLNENILFFISQLISPFFIAVLGWIFLWIVIFTESLKKSIIKAFSSLKKVFWKLLIGAVIYQLIKGVIPWLLNLWIPGSSWIQTLLTIISSIAWTFYIFYMFAKYQYENPWKEEPLIEKIN